MLRKPWPIQMIAALFFLAPLVNLFFFFITNKLQYGQFWTEIDNPVETYLALALFPVAGYAVWRVRKWSYPLFLSSMFCIFCHHISNFNSPMTYSSSGIIILAVILNIFIVGYFLLPEVKKLYYTPTLRWWESKPRYNVLLDCHDDHGYQIGHIENISIGGAFFVPTVSFDIAKNDILTLNFSFRGNRFRLSGKVVHLKKSLRRGFGVQFISITELDSLQLKSVLYSFKQMGLLNRPLQVRWWQVIFSAAF